MNNMNLNEIKSTLDEISSLIHSVNWDLKKANSSLFELKEKLKSREEIKDVENFKKILKRDNLYSIELEEFIDNYMKFYN